MDETVDIVFCVTRVAEEHSMFVKWTVTYSTGVSSRGRENEVVEWNFERGRGGYRRSGEVIVELD